MTWHQLSATKKGALPPCQCGCSLRHPSMERWGTDFCLQASGSVILFLPRPEWTKTDEQGLERKLIGCKMQWQFEGRRQQSKSTVETAFDLANMCLLWARNSSKLFFLLLLLSDINSFILITACEVTTPEVKGWNLFRCISQAVTRPGSHSWWGLGLQFQTGL